MSFPTSPANGQQAVVNNVVYQYSSASNRWTRVLGTIGNLTSTGNLTVTGNITAGNLIATHYGNIVGATGGNAYITGTLIPTSNIAYDLGTTTQRFRSLYLSGNTIDLGGASIKTDATTGAIAIVPQPTTANPNPTGIVVSPSGTISTVATTGGVVTANAIASSSNTAATSSTSTFSNANVTATLTAGNITTTNGVFWANGAVYSPASTKTLSIALNSGLVSNISLTAGYIPVLNNSGGTVNIATY